MDCTLKSFLASEEFSYAISNFIDSFNSHPIYDMVEDSILGLDNISIEQKSYASAIVDMLCGKHNITRPGWIFDESVYLDSPVFALEADKALKILLLQESTRWFRSRNLFVSSNCGERV